MFETIFVDKKPPDDKRINQLIYWCKKFHQLGLAPESSGNLSFRTKKGFVITATGFELKDVRKGNLVEILEVKTEKDRLLVFVKGKAVPSKESILHSVAYNLRPKVKAVFHLHDQEILELGDQLKIPCTEKEQPRGSYELAEEAGKLLGLKKDINYFVLKNHGVVSLGKTLKEAGKLAELMNKKAQEVKNEKNSRI